MFLVRLSWVVWFIQFWWWFYLFCLSEESLQNRFLVLSIYWAVTTIMYYFEVIIERLSK